MFYKITHAKKWFLFSVVMMLVTSGYSATTLNLKLYIQGYYNHATGLMRPVFANQNISAAAGECDYISVTLYSSITFLQAFPTQNIILHQDGTATCTFPITSSASYYIAVTHRNAVGTWSTVPEQFNVNGLVDYDFTTAITKAYGDNMVQLPNGAWAFFSGDIVKDAAESIDILDLGELESKITTLQAGYEPTDVNGDGNIDLLDLPFVIVGVSNFIFSSHP